MSPLDAGRHVPAEGHGGEHLHASRRGYLVGFGLSALLTALAFWLVMTGALHNPQATIAAIMVMAIAQILVQTVAFLHVNRRAEEGWTLVAMIFTAVLLLILIVGSLWIMYHLRSNTMPMEPGAL